MELWIVEDEMLAAERLKMLLNEYDPEIRVTACTDSIEETVALLQQRPHPDLMLLDIHLSDGHSFEIFRRVPFRKPVIFTTAYDQYAIEAFGLFSIDYILKPVTLQALARALNKYKALASDFVPADYRKLIQQLSVPSQTVYKNRFLAKVGQRLFFVDTSDIAYFQAENKLVYLVDRSGNKYLIEYTLERLESMLDPREFFRLNRRFIVKISAIEHIKPYFNSRLKLCVKGTSQAEELIISRDRVAEFKAWAEA